MRAIQVTRFGDPDVLQLTDLAQPRPAADEILIKIMGNGNCGKILLQP